MVAAHLIEGKRNHKKIFQPLLKPAQFLNPEKKGCRKKEKRGRWGVGIGPEGGGEGLKCTVSGEGLD